MLLKSGLLVITAYLIGSIPFSYLFPKVKGKNTQKEGTGNVGATNALITAGPLPAILALFGDVAKGFLAIMLARYFQLPPLGLALVALAAVVGHDFSVFLKFRGGKGVATTGGILLALDPLFMFLVLLVWVLTMMLIRYFIPATVATLCLIPFLMWAGSWPLEYYLFGVGNALLGIYAHRLDLQRFLAGQELTIEQAIKKHRKP